MPINTVYFGYGIVLEDGRKSIQKRNEIRDELCKKLELPSDSNDDVVYDELNARIGTMLAEKYPNETIPDNIFCIMYSDVGPFLYITEHSISICTHDSEHVLGEEGDLSLKLDYKLHDAVAMFKDITGIEAKWSWMLVPDFFP